MWHQRYSNETASRKREKKNPAIDALGQNDENFYPKI
jgi:hypothetical protein